MALRASSAAESPVIYVLLSESSRFKSEVSGQGSVPYKFVCMCVFGCVYESLWLSANINVYECLRSRMRANSKLPAGCLGLFGLEGIHSFDCEHAWKSFGVVKITGCERWGHLYYKLRPLVEGEH